MTDDRAVIRARVDVQVKKAFDAACKANDLNSSQVLRSFINDYIKKNGQSNLF